MNDALARLLLQEDCAGVEAIRVLGRRPFYEDAELPFSIHGGGNVFRIEPERGFRREHLARTADEAAVIADCPDAPGWLVPTDIVAGWLDHNITCARLEDLIVSHPLYAYLTGSDEAGHSRGGGRGGLLHWVPGIPEAVALRGPEWLPDDEDAPEANRDRGAYVEAVADLLDELQHTFRPLELGLELRLVPG